MLFIPLAVKVADLSLVFASFQLIFLKLVPVEVRQVSRVCWVGGHPGKLTYCGILAQQTSFKISTLFAPDKARR